MVSARDLFVHVSDIRAQVGPISRRSRGWKRRWGVLQRAGGRQQELRLGGRHRPRHRRPHQGRGRVHGPRGFRRQAHGRDAVDHAGAHGALGDGHAALRERRTPPPGTTANTKLPVANPHQGKGGFRIEVSRYLSNALYTGNSAKAWYLLADPSDLPVIEMAFLNGQEAPTVETSDADFNPPTCSASGCVGTTTSPPRRQPAGPARRREEQGRGVKRAHRGTHWFWGPRRRALWRPRGVRVDSTHLFTDLSNGGYNRRMGRSLYIVLSLCSMLAASSCNRSPKPTVGPSPSAASAAQLAKIQGSWALAPARPGPEPLPFTQLIVTVQGTVVSVVANPGNVAFQGTTEYQQPRPGGGRLRLTAQLPSTAGEITIVVDWSDDAREGNGGWFAGAGLKDTLTFAVAPRP